jgi:hypothetical protein
MMLAFAFSLLLQQPIHVRLVTDEPEVALQILQKRHESKSITEADWKSLFETEGYKRLKERELGMKRDFTEEEFKKFMMSDDLLKQRASLESALARWKKVAVEDCARTSLSYLPAGSELRATVMYLIKPRHNSFVWGTDGPDPAVMLYLDPDQATEDQAMTIAHEFHHIGYSSRCPSKEYKVWYEKQPNAKQTALTWLRALGEGFAVLASAGGPDTEPFKYSTKEVKDAFKMGVASNPERMKMLEAFLAEVLDGKLDETKAQERAMEFYGLVGPWYTTGWVIACTIERAFGRQKLLDCYLDPRLILATYNAAAKQLGNLPIWRDELVTRLS